MTIEKLERRALLSVSLNTTSGLLSVSGTSTGDVVSITQSGTTVTVTDAKVKYTYAAASIKHINVSLGSGADSVSIANTVLIPATITAGSGIDTLIGGGGATVINGGAGTDSIECGSGPSTVSSGSGGGYLFGGTGLDSITAGSGATTLTAGSGPDTLIGGSGIDTYSFGIASVTPVTPPTQIVYEILPGKGTSNLNFSGLPATVDLNVDLTNDLGVATFAGRTVATGATGQAAKFTGVVGNGGNDNFVANAANDSIVGGAGSDTLTAGSGNDTLSGAGASTEYIFLPQSGPAHDYLNQAVGGTNVLNFEALPAGDDLVLNLNYDVMAAYDDVTISDGKAGQYKNFNEILEGEGDDLITCNNDGDSLLGGDGYDTIFGGTGADLFFLGAGYDVVSGGGGADVIFGSSGNYVIYATNYVSDPSLIAPPVAGQTAKTVAKPAVTPAGVQVFAGSGDASIVGSAGNDTLEGSGADTIHGLGGQDYISAGGSGESSEIFGDGGTDTIYAGLGDTTIDGGGGDDSITAGTAGGANDFIDNNIPDNSSTSSGAAVIDSVALTANAVAVQQGLATPTYPLLGTAGVGNLIAGKSANMTVIGGLGDDTIQGGDGPATIVAGSGNNLLVAGNGNDVVQGGSGDDTIVSGFGPDLLEGGSGNTTFFNVNGFADTVIAGAGNNIAEMDPTGESTLVGNFQYVYDPGFVADAPAPPPDAPIIPSIAVANSAMQSAAAPALIIKPAVTPAVALPVPTVVKGVLTVGSKTATVNQGIAVSQSGTVITVAETSVGVFTFSSSAISSVSVNTGPGSDYVSFNTLDVPASANVGNGNNYVVGGTANETLIGGTGNDTLIGGPGSNLIEGGNGSNSLYGGTGNDTIDGGTGFDNIFPGGFGVSLLNDSEADSIKGGTGTEAVFMNCNADSLVARLDLGTITDVQTGAVTHISGVKNFYAGPGNSLIVTPPTVASFFVNAGSGVGTIFGTGVRAILVGGVGTPTVIANNKGALIDLTGTTGGKTAFYAVTDGTDSLDAGSGQDVLIQLVAAP